MEFAKKRGRRRDSVYPTSLQLYKLPPTEVVSLEEFEELAEKRLKLLKQVEEVREKAAHDGVHRGNAEYDSKMRIVVKGGGIIPYRVNPTKKEEEKEDNYSIRRRDHISHYILRLAYCRTEEMRRWFLSQETELLRYRYVSCGQEERNEFLTTHKSDFNFQNEEISDDEKGADILSFYNEPPNSGPHKFIKVPFTSALDLVQHRSVVLKNGFIYLPERSEMIVSLICNKFRARVSEELVKTLHHLAMVDDDERIAPLIKNLKRRYLGEDFSDRTEIAGQVHPGQIDGLSKESFPPCMHHLHDSLRSEHHLRHYGRLQYGLFLKSIGLSLDDALSFWRAEFTRKIDVDKFDKQYAYSIRHNYGKEGKRANYTPYSCVKIITSNTPSPGDHHGCPFRHWDNTHLSRFLESQGFSNKDGRSILEYVDHAHYQLACQRYFEITHRLPVATFSLEHPTQYFLESRLVRGGLGVVEPEQDRGGMESGHDSAMDITADLSVGDLEDLDKFE